MIMFIYKHNCCVLTIIRKYLKKFTSTLIHKSFRETPVARNRDANPSTPSSETGQLLSACGGEPHDTFVRLMKMVSIRLFG